MNRWGQLCSGRAIKLSVRAAAAGQERTSAIGCLQRGQRAAQVLMPLESRRCTTFLHWQDKSSELGRMNSLTTTVDNQRKLTNKPGPGSIFQPACCGSNSWITPKSCSTERSSSSASRGARLQSSLSTAATTSSRITRPRSTETRDFAIGKEQQGSSCPVGNRPNDDCRPGAVIGGEQLLGNSTGAAGRDSRFCGSRGRARSQGGAGLTTTLNCCCCACVHE